MTEQEYIDTHDLMVIRSAKSSLMELIPETSNVIISGQLDDIVTILSYWESKLVSEIKTTKL